MLIVERAGEGRRAAQRAQRARDAVAPAPARELGRVCRVRGAARERDDEVNAAEPRAVARCELFPLPRRVVRGAARDRPGLRNRPVDERRDVDRPEDRQRDAAKRGAAQVVQLLPPEARECFEEDVGQRPAVAAPRHAERPRLALLQVVHRYAGDESVALDHRARGGEESSDAGERAPAASARRRCAFGVQTKEYEYKRIDIHTSKQKK